MNNIASKFSLKVIIPSLILIFLSGSVFATETSLWNKSNENNSTSIDHSGWQSILNNYLVANHPSGVNRFRYVEVNSADRQSLKKYLSTSQQLDPRSYQKAEQMAYWINLYNALTVNMILENYPVKSIKKIGKKFFSFGPWDDEIANVAGQNLTLNDIEHKILRPIWKDPRIHYAVNCASYGCPNLSATAYTSANIESLLEQGGKDYVNHKRGVSISKDELLVSSIYHWYKKDFGDNDKQLIAHLKKYANPDLKQALDKFSGSIEHDYNWSLNDAR